MRTIVGPALAAALTTAVLVTASPASALLPVEQERAPVEQERTAPRTPGR